MRLLVLLFAAILPTPPASALLIEDALPADSSGIAALWVRDCGNLERDKNRTCEEWQTQFFEGDSGRLRAALYSRKAAGRLPDEVWLYSGGGDLNEGILIARLLRQFQLTVRVRAGTACISACTVAFMGGLFRFIDPGATYEVHSASRYSGSVDPKLAAALASQPQAFQKLAHRQYVSARYTGRRLFALFQRTLLLPLGRENSVQENDQYFERWALAAPSPHWYRSAAQDAARLGLEGQAALQDILMRIERDAMAQTVADLRAMLPSLGRRAEPALRMLEAMYLTSIKETAILNPETLLRMGYVTKEFQPNP